MLYGVAFTLIAGAVFLVTGLYRGIWRYASVPDLFNIARAAALTGLVFLPVMFLFTRLDTLPRSFLLINWLVLVALLGGPRLCYRLFKDRRLDHLFERDRAASVPVLLISTKDGADTFIRECVRDPTRCTAWSACCPTRRRGSAGRFTGSRFSGRSIRWKRSSPISTGAAGDRTSW